MTPSRSEGIDRELLDRAREAAQSAYAPYSRFRVGAAVRGERGIHVGVNVENASYGLALCAERAALTAAVTAGERALSDLAVVCIDASGEEGIEALVPCGACRQWLAELAPKARVHVDGQARSLALDELLPTPFRIRPSR